MGCCILFANSLSAQLIIQSTATVSVKGNTTSTVDIQGTGTLALNGTHPQNLNVNGHYIPNLQINNDSNISLTGSAQLSGILTFTTGNILLNNFNLTLDNSATITGAANTRFVTTNNSGYLIKRGMGATVFQYPVGNSTSTYNPLTLSNTGTIDTIGVRCLASMFSNGLTGIAFTKQVVDASWDITEQTSGGSNLSITPGWYASDELTGFDRTNVTLAHYNTIASSWDTSNIQTGPASGSNPYSYTRTGVTNTGTFALGTWASPTPAINSTLLATQTVDSIFSYTITATNSPTSFNATGLPAGLNINTVTGIISGTVTTIGTYSVTISATNGYGTTNQTLVIHINPLAPVITSPATANATTGTAFSYSITATNNPTSFNATGLTAGLNINTVTGTIAGTPTIAGKDTVIISATNAGGTGSDTLIITVKPPTPVITSASTATGTTGNSFTYTITASNNPISFNATGLPSGLNINTTTGVISGTPAAAGSSTVNINATNAGGTGSATLTITINNPPAPVITSSTTATVIVNNTFSYTITASNNPTSFNATGLPTGLSIDVSTGIISGTPTTTGSYPVTITATNLGGTDSKTLTINVNNPPAPIITSTATASGIVDSTFNYAITASNNPGSYNATALPAGLIINTSTGVISGTPTIFGVYTSTISATNAGGTDSITLTITIDTLPPISGIVVYPNPLVNGGSLHVTLLGWQNGIAFAIYGINGKLVKTGTVTVSGGAIIIPITNLSSGAYALHLSNGSTIITREFVVLQH